MRFKNFWMIFVFQLAKIALNNEPMDSLAGHHSRPAGEPLRLRVLARDVSLARSAPQGSTILNALPARIVCITPDAPGQMLVALQLGGTRLLARISQRSQRELALAPGDAVFAQVKSVALVD